MTKKIKHKCSICFEDIINKNDLFKTTCRHYFHFDCIKRWNLKHKSCPLCRHTMRRIIKCNKEGHRGTFKCMKCRKKSCFNCYLELKRCPCC